jgi:hypothetical protein
MVIVGGGNRQMVENRAPEVNFVGDNAQGPGIASVSRTGNAQLI